MTNALLLRRRGMMGVQGGVLPDYVQSDLVLWLDGILQGSTANALTDLVSGHVFNAVGNVAFNADNLQFGYNGVSYLTNTAGTYLNNPVAAVGTIEVVAEKSGSLYDIFIPDINNKSICFIERSTRGVLYTYGNSTTRGYLTTLTKASYSISASFRKENGADMTMSSSNATFVSTVNLRACVGRSNNSYFNGKVYCIRIYQRRLTEDEILHNLAIDNERFNLGLTLTI